MHSAASMHQLDASAGHCAACAWALKRVQARKLACIAQPVQPSCCSSCHVACIKLPASLIRVLSGPCTQSRTLQRYLQASTPVCVGEDLHSSPGNCTHQVATQALEAKWYVASTAAYSKAVSTSARTSAAGFVLFSCTDRLVRLAVQVRICSLCAHACVSTEASRHWLQRLITATPLQLLPYFPLRHATSSAPTKAVKGKQQRLKTCSTADCQPVGTSYIPEGPPIVPQEDACH